jgi:hypothetical protein
MYPWDNCQTMIAAEVENVDPCNVCSMRFVTAFHTSPSLLQRQCEYLTKEPGLELYDLYRCEIRSGRETPLVLYIKVAGPSAPCGFKKN